MNIFYILNSINLFMIKNIYSIIMNNKNFVIKNYKLDYKYFINFFNQFPFQTIIYVLFT